MEEKLYFGPLLISKDNMEKTLEKIRKYCAYQDRCTKEVQTKLRSLGISESDFEEIINQLIEEGFINEERFTQSYIRGKINTKGWGVQKIIYNLRLKGIEEHLIKKEIAKLDSQSIEKNLISLIEKWITNKELTFSTKQRLYRYLMSRGYSSGEISQVLTQLDLNFYNNDNF